MSTNNALNVNPSTPLAPDDGGTGVSNGSNTLTVSANSSIDQNVTTIGNPTFQGVISGATAGIANNYFQSLSPTSGQGYMLVRSPDNSGDRINTLTNIATTGDRTWSFPDETGTVALTSGLTGYATKVQVQQSAFNIGLDTGVADAYVVDLDPVVGALTDGLLITFTALNQNDTNAPTLTVNGITKGIFNQSGGAVAVGDVTGYLPSFLMYAEQQDYWILLNGAVSNMTAAYFTNGAYTSGADSGTSSAYNVTLDYGAGSFSPSFGTFVSFVPANNSDAAPTLTVNGAGPYQMISQNGVALPAGALLTTRYAMVTYGTNSAGQSGWILLNPQGVYIPSSRTAGFQPVTVSGTSQALVAGGNYIFNNAAATTGTLPTSANSSIGDTIKIKGRSSAAWIIQANTSQVIKLGSVSSSAAGTATSASGSDSIQLVYVATNEWSVDWALSSAIVLA